MESPRQNQLPVTPQLTIVQGDGGKGFRLKGVAKLFDERTVATLVPKGVDISFTELCSEIIRIVNLHQPRMPGRHLMASDIALSSSSDHQRVDCHFRVEDGPLPEPPISGYLAPRGMRAYPDTKLICGPQGNVVAAVSRTEEMNKREVLTTMESPRQDKSTPAGFEWVAELIAYATERIAVLQESVGQPGYELAREATKQSIEMKVLQIAMRISGGHGAMQINHATLTVEPGAELTAGKMVYADKSGNLVGSIDQRPLLVTKVDAVTHHVSPGVIQTTGQFDLEFDVATADGPKKVRSWFNLRPGCRVGFFSAPGKQHSATVAPDGKTLIDVTPPIDTNAFANKTTDGNGTNELG